MDWEPTNLLSASPANRASSCSVLLPTEHLLFGTGRQIAWWDCTTEGPLRLFKAHRAEITTLKRLFSHSSALVSGDSGGAVLISIPDKFKVLARLTGHKASISCLSSIRLPTSNDVEHYLILTGASDGSLISYKVSIDPSSYSVEHVDTLQTIQLGHLIPLDAALAFLPNQFTHLVLALGVTDGSIATYSLDLPSLVFSSCFRLPGHTDWVRCLDFTLDPKQPKNLLLVSGSQDTFIRIWRCEEQEAMVSSSSSKTNATGAIDDPFQTLEELAQTLKEEGKLPETNNQVSSGEKNRQTVEMKRYFIKNTCWSFVSDALLYGHEGWVTNVHWCMNPTGSLQLLSTSSDRSMIMWRPSEEFDDVWLNVERFGELANSTNLGFFGAHYFFNPQDNSETVLASGWTRAWHRWSKANKDSVWHPQIAPTAHYGPVTGLDWEKEGDYLASCSADQTTRLWGPWRKKPQGLSSPLLKNPSWHEICRPQVHGHDLFGISFIGDHRSQFVSISEEKVIRVFSMTQDFVQVTQELGTILTPFVEKTDRPERAIVPALGLSNRVEDLTDSHQAPVHHQLVQQPCPPFEDQLLSRTLWPEIDKIYGHPSELSTITSSHSGNMIASGCHANTGQTASIRLHHSTGNFGPIHPDGILEAHQLTVTRLAFNADDSKLLSVSRDRSWVVWNKIDQGFRLEYRLEKAHARVVWDASWAPPSPDYKDTFFITGSRDKSVKSWVQSPDSNSTAAEDRKNWKLSGLIKCDQPVKSCTISPHLWNHKQFLLAVGLEDGVLSLYSSKTPDSWQPLKNLNLTTVYHEGPINRISFFPKKIQDDEQGNQCRLATAGEDGIVKIFDFKF